MGQNPDFLGVPFKRLPLQYILLDINVFQKYVSPLSENHGYPTPNCAVSAVIVS